MGDPFDASYGERLAWKLGGQDSWVALLRMSSISASRRTSFSSMAMRLEMVSQDECHDLKYEVYRNTRGYACDIGLKMRRWHTQISLSPVPPSAPTVRLRWMA